jgi:hypothetical protein
MMPALSLSTDRLAARLARDANPEPIEFQETDTDFATGWKCNYHAMRKVE